jgi:hypothetical protein
MATDELQLREIIQQIRMLIETENLSFLEAHYQRLLSKL